MNKQKKLLFAKKLPKPSDSSICAVCKFKIKERKKPLEEICVYPQNVGILNA